MEVPQGPFCQSCAMPMDAAEKFGTNADGGRCEDYCTHCYQNGAFTEPQATLEGMIAICSRIMAREMDITADEAKAMLSDFMPTLKRWRGTA
jgi:hypothetical protein